MNTPYLLNDDGSASMATALMMSHHGMRRDLALFRIALRQVREGDRSRVAALQGEWQSFRGVLHGHHQAEDQGLFPHIKSQQPALAPVIDRLSADHRRIDPVLERGDRAFADLIANLAASATVVEELSALLAPHLATEEAEVTPFLRDARAFPPPASDSEAEMFAQGFAWSSHGIDAQVLDRVYAMLPEVVSTRLPTARAAFGERYQRVWGHAKTGASRTPIPDWLTSG